MSMLADNRIAYVDIPYITIKGNRVSHLIGRKKKNKSNANVKYTGNKKSITRSILLSPVGIAINETRKDIIKIKMK